MSCADYKNKVFAENEWAAVDKEMGFEEGKEFFLISYAEWHLNEELARYFTNALVLSNGKSLPTSKNMRFIIKTCRSTKPSNVFKVSNVFIKLLFQLKQ